MGQRQFVLGPERRTLVERRFGLAARGDQFARTRLLAGAQGGLAFGDALQLPGVEHLQVERHDVHGDILADALEVLHGGREVEPAPFDLAIDPESLEQRHRGRDIERSRLLVVVLVGVVAREHAAERGVGADRSVQVGQPAEPRRRELHLLLLHGDRALPHGDVVLLRMADAVVERPRAGGRVLCGGSGLRREPRRGDQACEQHAEGSFHGAGHCLGGSMRAPRTRSSGVTPSVISMLLPSDRPIPTLRRSKVCGSASSGPASTCT